MALCDAYALSADPELKQPAQKAIDFIVYAQDPTGGGWRYQPREPGDTSVLGWQMSALQSAHAAGLTFPPQTIRKAAEYLDAVQFNGGAQYRYTTLPANLQAKSPAKPAKEPEDPLGRSAATTAIGLYARMSSGWRRDNPALQTGIGLLTEKGPNSDNMYFNYYATRAMRVFGGDGWDDWNSRVHDLLQKSQSKDGHKAGSWYFEGGIGQERGGRLYSTCMALMTLTLNQRLKPFYDHPSP
jgi:hypothetical protein